MKEKTNEEIIKENRDTLLDRIDTPGYQGGYPYGLMDEASKEIKLLRSERDEARRQVCEFEMVNIKCAHDYATYRGWDCYDNIKV